MAQLSIAAAARAAGKDRGTIHRYIKSGRLSSTKNAAGHTVVETAELLRVFGSLQTDGGKTAKNTAIANAAQHVENSSMQHILEATLELVKQQLKASQEREEKLLAMLSQEQESRRELERRLLPPGSEAPSTGKEDPVVLETASPANPTFPKDTNTGTDFEKTPPSDGKKKFFASLFGRYS